ncbi:MAG: alpha/beta hydrolase, partial [Calditrichaeota bacterium]
KSGGDFKSATTEDFASDVLAAVQFLKTRSEIDARQIGLVGHSEGGLIAPMVAARSRDVAFIVLLAGPALPGERILLLQKALIMKAEGASDSLVALDRRMSEEIFSIIKREPDEAAAREKILAYDQEAWEAVPEELKQEAEKYGDHRSGLMRGLQMSLTPWFRFFLTYDPGPTLQKVTCPVLALYGEKDLQVPAGENRPALAAALKAGGNREVTIEILPGLNHLFQTAETGAPGEYGKIEETFSPVALRAISDWIQARRKPVNR